MVGSPRVTLAALGVAVSAVLVGCTTPDPQMTGPGVASDAARGADGAPGSGSGSPTGEQNGTVEVEVIATGLQSPWGLDFLPDGRAVVTSRDTARIVLVDADGAVTSLTGPGARHLVDVTVLGGEGGLLGVAVSPDFATDGALYVYLTHAGGNGVLRMQLDGTELSPPQEVLADIPAARNHNGGQLAFGPDGMLYVATGDAGTPADSQDVESWAGKVLRVTPLGAVPEDNPVSGSPVWTLGHRNVQGLGWDAAGRMFATEFGQDTWDELNLLEAGGNYGWPEVEGDPEGDGGGDDGGTGEGGGGDGGGDDGGGGDGGADADGGGDGGGEAGAKGVGGTEFRRPLAVWEPADASPSGLAVTDEAVYLAGLRGERLWRVPFVRAETGAAGAESAGATAGRGGAAGASPAPDLRLGTPEALLAGEFGRLRAVAVAPDGSLWVMTNNTDGRGSPGQEDDRILRVTVG